MYLGIRPDGSYEKIVQVPLSDVHIYPLFEEDRGLYDIGEYDESNVNLRVLVINLIFSNFFGCNIKISFNEI